jgi:hypothetical protein
VGGNATVLASGQNHPSAITVDDANVYWSVSTTSPINPIAIMECAIGGCGNNPTVLAATPGNNVTRIITDAGMVYWSALAGGILTCPRTGCGTGPTSITTGITCSSIAGPIAMDPTNIEPRKIYFMCNGGISWCPRTGCNGQVNLVGGGFNSGGAPSLDFTTDGTYVYWDNDQQGALQECRVTGCPNFTPPNLASNQTFCTSNDSLGPPIEVVATDAVNVYWAGNGATKCAVNPGFPPGGCGTTNASPTPLATGCGHGLAADGLNVYWSDDVTGLVKCSVAGCNGTPTQMSSLHARAIAVDGTSVYWTDPSTSSVYKMPK